MTPDIRALTDEGHLSLDKLAVALRDTARALLAVLQAERTALAGGSSDDLDPLFEDKATLGDRLDTLETRRQAQPQAKNGDRFRRALSPSGRSAWDAYLGLLGECREANAINGRLVHARQRHVRQALMLLRGAAGTGDAATYNASGTASDAFDPVTLGNV